METKNDGYSLMNGLSPAIPVHPGSILGEELKARGIRQKDFAQQIGMQATHLSAIINGARNITPALADKIAGGLTEIPSSIWVHLQEQYNADTQRKKIHTNLLVSGYLGKAEPVAALAEPAGEYGSKVTCQLTIPAGDLAMLECLASRLGWEAEPLATETKKK
jgi:addiction module antidote protein, HigA family